MTESATSWYGGVRHIVWDWNGTLLDDNHANLAAVNRIRDRFDMPRLDLAYWRCVFRRPLKACYEELLGREFVDGEWERLNAAYEHAYRQLLPTCDLAEGVPWVLRAWSAGGGTQSLLSMADHEHVRTLVVERGIAEHFTRVEGRRENAARDSKAEHLAEHLDAQEVDPATVVLIGDIDDDAHAAERAGAGAVLVANGLMDPERLRATGHPVVDSVSEAVELLRHP